MTGVEPAGLLYSDESRSLSHDARLAWLGVFRVSRALLHRLDRVFVAEFDLPLVAGELLFVMSVSPNSMRVTDLVDHVTMSQSSVTRTLNRLEDQGYVDRKPSITDGRVSALTITDSGVALIARMREVEERVVAEMLTGHLSAAQVTALVDAWRALPWPAMNPLAPLPF